MDQFSNILTEVSSIDEPCKGTLAIRRLSKKVYSPKEIWLKRHSDNLKNDHGINDHLKAKYSSVCDLLNNIDSHSGNNFDHNNFFDMPKDEFSNDYDTPLDFSNNKCKLTHYKTDHSQNKITSESHAFSYILKIQPLTPINSVPNIFTFSPISISSPIKFGSTSNQSFIASPSNYSSEIPLFSPASTSNLPKYESRRHLYARRRSPSKISTINLDNTEHQIQVALPTTPINLSFPPSPRLLLSPIQEMITINKDAHITIKTTQFSQHKCSYCQRCFSRSDMLSRHLRLHTGHRPYECPFCSQVFSRSDHLQTHLRTHTGEKPYSCAECGYAAPRRDMVTRHMRVHENRGEAGCRVKKTKLSESKLQCLKNGNDEIFHQYMKQQIQIMYKQKLLSKDQLLDSKIQDFIYNELKKLNEPIEMITGQLINLQFLDNNIEHLAKTAISDSGIKCESKDQGFEEIEPHASCSSPEFCVFASEYNNLSRTISEGSIDSGVSYLTPCTPASTMWSPNSPELFIFTTESANNDATRFQWPSNTNS